MKISMFYIGATQEQWLKDGIALFEKRIRHYLPFEMILVGMPRSSKNLPPQLQKEHEGKVILQAIEKADHAVLLDVTGRKFSSEAFSGYIQQVMNKGTRNLAFVIGGPFGFSDEVYHTVSDRLSLSEMTCSHQLVRLVFLEQLYRAFTIIRGEPYHHAG
jgi:23S rRNA (pseudouridine1915-N3)-methyltransferase